MTEVTIHYEDADRRGNVSARLLPLPPQGHGTGDVESLSSYVVRLARAQSVRTRHLLPHLTRGTFQIRGSSDRFAEARRMNGNGALAAAVVLRLRELNGVDATSLTFLLTSEILDPVGKFLLKEHREWCSSCLCEETESPLRYDRLYWAIRGVEYCVIHQSSLQSRCPSCGRMQPHFARKPFLDRCNHCAALLITPVPENGRRPSERTLWQATAIRDLIARFPEHDNPVSIETLHQNLRAALNLSARPALKCLAERLNVSYDHLRNWILRGRRPCFAPLMDLCYALDLAPSALLSPTQPMTFPDKWKLAGRKQWIRRVPSTEKEEQELKSYLQTCANSPCPPKPLAEICRMMSRSPAFLRRVAPELVEMIQEKRRRWCVDRQHLRRYGQLVSTSAQ